MCVCHRACLTQSISLIDLDLVFSQAAQLLVRHCWIPRRVNDDWWGNVSECDLYFLVSFKKAL